MIADISMCGTLALLSVLLGEDLIAFLIFSHVSESL